MTKMMRGVCGVLAISSGFLLASCSSTDASGALEKLKSSGLLKTASGALSTDEIVLGLKEALSKGSETVVGQLGQSDGFNGDPSIRIPLPKTLAKARDFAAKVGLEGSFDELEVKLNRAAELATPKAKSLFLGAIKDMSVEDAKGILRGPDNAATEFFEKKTRTQLAGEMRPLVEGSLSQVGAVKYFNQLVSRYQKIPLAPKIDADLTGHVVNKGMDGIFAYVAKEEKAIRSDPVKRTTELLRKVFASK
ncbi:MAG: DUF4197 domain-containing protein [Burkholderiaceae bacterium]